MDLRSSNMFYRCPELYDEVNAETGRAVADSCAGLIAEYAAHARTVLDLGCGTGRELGHLAGRFRCVGVDVQPQLVEYARRRHPEVDVLAGDLRDFRLGRTMDVILCLGNTLAYLPDDDGLRAAFGTFATHAQAGTLLIVGTQLVPVERIEPRTARVETPGLRAEVTVRYEWNPGTRTNTMYRDWRRDDGRVHHDTIRRRVLDRDELERGLADAGFALVDGVEGVDGLVVGRFSGTGGCDMGSVVDAPSSAGDGRQSVSRPRAMATVTAAVRSSTPSLPKMRSRCVLTVASAMHSRCPVAALVRPWATRRSTSTSRGDRVSCCGARIRLTRRAATDGASTVSPRAAALMASASSARVASLSR